MNATAFAKTLVPSGSYVIRPQAPEILEAFLGTCVGVAAFDGCARVGGLLHVLLSEPGSPDTPWPAECYAATGLPLFIEEILNAGARRETLNVCVAGGALVGPLSPLDVDLDIGGRTLEVVGKILNRERIHVSRFEVGGIFSCRLALNLKTGEFRIDPAFVQGSVQAEPPRPVDREGIHRAISRIRPVPQVAFKIIRMIRDRNYDMDDLAKHIRQDQVITARVLRLCHSPVFGAGVRADSIDRALVVLGEKRLLQLALSAYFEDFFTQEPGGYSLCKGGLFQHALATAHLAETLARRIGVPEDIAYTCGLLHDIGKVVLDQCMKTHAAWFYRKACSESMTVIEIEEEIFGMGHAEAGGILAKEWNFPDPLKETIRWHHLPEEAKAEPLTTHIVYFADLVASRFWAGREVEIMGAKNVAQRLVRLGFSPKDFQRLVESLPLHNLDNLLAASIG